jgi:hypothetical protein
MVAAMLLISRSAGVLANHSSPISGIVVENILRLGSPSRGGGTVIEAGYRRMVAGRGIVRNHGRNNNSPATATAIAAGLFCGTARNLRALRFLSAKDVF